MVDNTVELIRRILSGDDEAFSLLMRKHQEGVHALIWRKIGDFYIAEELTQDTFIQAYKNLGTLKDPRRFKGWLYVIANRRCINWIKRNKAKMNALNMQSLENTSSEEVEEASYAHHTSHQRETEITEYRRNLAKTLLQELPESERTVVTLYYLGKMTTKEIGKFLGVSMNTVKSRLRRARKRLQEEALVRETLNGVQLPDTLIENVMRHIADLNPTPTPSVKKPLLPWAAVGAAVVLVILFGSSSQYLLRFQQPYSFDARSEPTIEFVDEPIYLEIVAKPAVRNQVGRTIIPGKNSGAGMQTSQTTLTTNAYDDTAKFSASQWTQSTGPQGSVVFNLFKAADGTVYAAAKTGLYRLTPNATWVLLNTDITRGQYRIPITEHQGTLYTVSTDEVFASEDGGETWNPLGRRPEGIANGFIVTAAIQKHDPQTGITLYLALQEKGIFRSTDAGQHWTPLNNGLAGKRIYTVAAMGNTLFAGTNQGLYRLRSSNWHQLLTNTSGAVYALTVYDNDLYVGMARDIVRFENGKAPPLRDFVPKRIFHSADFGASWTEITPTDESQVMNLDAAIQVLAVGKTLFVLGITEFRSGDGGKTWTPLRSIMNSVNMPRVPAVAVDERTFYKADVYGISRTTDAGASWHPYVNGMTGPAMHDLIALNHRLYMHIGRDLVQSIDRGKTWHSVRFNTHEHTQTGYRTSVNSYNENLLTSNRHLTTLTRNSTPIQNLKTRVADQNSFDTDFYRNIKLTIADNVLYAVSIRENRPRLFRTSVAGDELIPIHGVPAFEAETTPDNSDILTYMWYIEREKNTYIGAFAVSGGTFYAQYKRKLFKWNPGDPEWTDTGLVNFDFPSALAVSGKTIYAGNGNGKLFQSFDSGDSWKDITSTLPIPFAHFKEITFVGSTVCIATDKGVLISDSGEHWRVITDKNRTHTVIDRFAADGTTLYGVGGSGAYRLDPRGRWELLSSDVPRSPITSLVISNDRLYAGTFDHGMFHISLEAQMDIANSF